MSAPLAATLPGQIPIAAPSGDRMPLIDLIKGLACAAIVGHHFALYGPLPEGASVLAPGLFAWLVHQGRLAVQVFLVVGGFLAAASLAPEGALRGHGHPASRIAQRYARLAMPYLVALIGAVLIAAFARPWLDDDLVPGAPTFKQLLAHGLLLQDLLGQDALSAGVWYVAVDFQLFALALAVFALSDSLRWGRWLGVALVLTVTVSSLVLFNRHASLDTTALYFFGAYGLGMLTYWIGRSRRTLLWVVSIALLAGLGVAALALDWRDRIAIALVTALALSAIQRAGWLGRVPAVGGATLVRLGRISYSLFLVHFPVLLLVSALGSSLWSRGPWTDVAGLALAAALSIGAAAALHRWVEQRPVSWRLLAALFGTLLLCGALGSWLFRSGGPA